MSTHHVTMSSAELADVAQSRSDAVLTAAIIALEDLAVEAAFLEERVVSDKVQEALGPLRAALAAVRSGVASGL